MQLLLYNVSDDRRKINKSLGTPIIKEVVFLKDFDTIAPSITLKESVGNSNYCQLNGKNYFIEKETILNNHLYYIDLLEDVLMTYRTRINDLAALLVESSDTFNDNKRDYNGENVRRFLKYNFENPLQGKSDILITSIGGSI